MQAEQMKQFTKSLTTLAELYDKALTPNVIELYFGALSDLPMEQVNEACKRAALSLKFFPKPVELREMVVGTAQDQADSAWYLLTQAVEKGAGQYSTFVENPVLAAAINRQFNGMIGAYRVLSGLDASDPMHASNRNAFRSCFQFCADATGGGKYFEGTNELNMRGLIWPKDRTDTVVVIGREVARLQMPFCRMSGELLPSAKQSLLAMNRRELAAFLPKTRPSLALASAPDDSEVVPMPDDVQEALAKFKGNLRLVSSAQAEEAA